MLLYDLLGRNANHGVERIVIALSCVVYGAYAYQFREHGQVSTSSEKRNGLFDPIDDVVRGMVACVNCPKKRSYAVNLGSNEHTSMMQVVNRYFVEKSKFQVTGDIRQGMADLERARALHGYKPWGKFEDALCSFFAWDEESESVPNGYERSLEGMKDWRLLHGHA